MKAKSLSLVILLGLVLVIAGATTAQGSTRDAALTFVADTYGEAKRDLDVVYEEMDDVPGIGEVTRFKIQSEGSGGSYTAVVDASGQAWTPEGFREAADEAYLQQYGKADLQLFSRFEANPGAVIPVSIWLAVDDAGLDANAGRPAYVGPASGQGALPAVSGELADAPLRTASPEVDLVAVEAGRQARFDRVAAVQAEVSARLSALGIEVTAVPRTPLLRATLGRDAIMQVAQDPAVSWIYADDVENADLR